MPVTPTYPGVYVQEIPSGVRSIAGVSTSIGMFIARARKGPLNQAIRLFSYTDFERTFSSDASVSTLPDHVRLFFLNGGTDCYVMRIANGATFAQVTLLNETGANGVLILTAKYPGAVGQTVRVDVSYGGANPEINFNMDIFREEVDAGGRVSIVEVESYKNLSMDPLSYSYAVDVLNTNSKLVTAALPSAGLPALVNGFSQSGVPVLHDSGDAQSLLDQWANRVGTASVGGANRINISVDGGTFVPVNFGAINVGGLANVGALETALADAINDALAANGQTQSSVTVELTPAGATPAAGAGATLDDGVTPADATSVLRITSNHAGNLGSVLIQPASVNDLAIPLGLGSAQGGLEVSAYSAFRPAPTGISLRASDPAVLAQFAALEHGDITQITLPAFDTSGAPTTANVPVNLLTGGAGAMTLLYANSEGGLRTALARIADAINQYKNANPLTFFWSATVAGNRLTLTSSRGTANSVGTLATAAADLTPFFNTPNVRYYSVGSLVAVGLQTQTPAVDEDGVATGTVTDGTAPTLTTYTDAFPLIEKQVDMFNLMVLPEDVDEGSPTVLGQVYGPASAFCQQRRAFLIMDAPKTWKTAQDATTGIAAMRVGLVKDHSAIYFPRVVIPNGRSTKQIGASGAVAGVMARTDASRGVWKAPAGTEADIRGIIGLEQRLSDPEHGSLNPRGINVLRAFTNGLVVYGARTNDGDDDFASEYKYIPVRRLALYMEESLYRGLKWVVFEPNDEPLWSQIRLNVGVFMHDLYRRGAFQGTKPSDAYFVKCDRETTTQSDINLGVVNILVGFAPLKPAEFVVLYLQQMAGQLQV